VKASFKVREEHGDSLDPIFVGQYLRRFSRTRSAAVRFARSALVPVELLQLFVGESEEIAILSRLDLLLMLCGRYSPGVQGAGGCVRALLIG